MDRPGVLGSGSVLRSDHAVPTAVHRHQRGGRRRTPGFTTRRSTSPRAAPTCPSAVARLVQLIPPARVDLVDEVLVRVGRRDLKATLDWPPVHLIHQLAYRVKRVHLGEARLRGPEGAVVDVIRYRDTMQQDRRCYRLTRHGVFIGEYKTPEELGKVVDLAALVEDGVSKSED